MKSLITWKVALLALLFSLVAPAVAHGQTYVRPSKGATITIQPAYLLSNSSSVYHSAIYDWTAFSTVVVTVTITGSNCQYYPEVYVAGSTSGVTVDSFEVTPNAIRVVPLSFDQYSVRVMTPYIQLQVGWYVATPAGTSKTCTARVTATPIPFDMADSPASMEDGGLNLTVDSSGVSFVMIPGVTILQNQGVYPVRCNGAAQTDRGFILAAGAQENDGTGGSITLQGVGNVTCYALPNSSGQTGSSLVYVAQY